MNREDNLKKLCSLREVALELGKVLVQGIRSFRAFMGHTLMEWDTRLSNIMVRWSHGCLWKATLLKSFRTFPFTSVLWRGMERESDFGKIYGGEINL